MDPPGFFGREQEQPTVVVPAADSNYTDVNRPLPGPTPACEQQAPPTGIKRAYAESTIPANGGGRGVGSKPHRVVVTTPAQLQNPNEGKKKPKGPGKNEAGTGGTTSGPTTYHIIKTQHPNGNFSCDHCDKFLVPRLDSEGPESHDDCFADPFTNRTSCRACKEMQGDTEPMWEALHLPLLFRSLPSDYVNTPQAWAIRSEPAGMVVANYEHACDLLDLPKKLCSVCSKPLKPHKVTSHIDPAGRKNGKKTGDRPLADRLVNLHPTCPSCSPVYTCNMLDYVWDREMDCSRGVGAQTRVRRIALIQYVVYMVEAGLQNLFVGFGEPKEQLATFVQRVLRPAGFAKFRECLILDEKEMALFDKIAKDAKEKNYEH